MLRYNRLDLTSCDLFSARKTKGCQDSEPCEVKKAGGLLGLLDQVDVLKAGELTRHKQLPQEWLDQYVSAFFLIWYTEID